MSEPYLGQIQAFGFNFAPRGWAQCNGQLLQISEYTALFSLLGTFYGGDGRTSFGLPDLRGRSPIHYGTGPGLPEFRIGSSGGQTSVTLNATQLPSITPNAAVGVSSDTATSDTPAGKFLAKPIDSNGEPVAAYAENGGGGNLDGVTSLNQGGNQLHNNLSPYLTVNYCIALTGQYPSRN